ncbi:glucosaminidase domain-containing protein [Rapidithrix thailandica]|uniref:Glucosaminidase domain-containing protein n=1 Tax=Rapidithrix thailandica TaxID=413964 RepID=A0AAW9S8E1_9BACT
MKSSKPFKLPIKYEAGNLRPFFPDFSVILPPALFHTNRLLLYIIIGLLVYIISQQSFPSIFQSEANTPIVSTEDIQAVKPAKSYAYYPMNPLHSTQPAFLPDPAKNLSYEEEFLVRKQLLITEALIKEKAPRIDQLSAKATLGLNKDISNLFAEIVLKNTPMEAHVLSFFTDTSKIKIFETALMEQAKFNVPASVKLAQAALETAYGNRVVENNYFGIKSKKRKGETTLTVEYLTPKQMKQFQGRVISKSKTQREGKLYYRCVVRDHFEKFSTPWESFRAHSLHLSTNPRYASLFTKGKDYRAWTEKLGNAQNGGVGYATNPAYGKLLKKIIEKYRLYLLDY